MADVTGVTDARLTPTADADGPTLTADGRTVTTDADAVTTASRHRNPTVTNTGMTADADAVTAERLTPTNRHRHLRHHVTHDADAVLRGERHLIRRDRHTVTKGRCLMGTDTVTDNTDTDTDPEPQPANDGWGLLVNANSLALIAPALIAVYAEFTGRDVLLRVSLTVAGLLFAVAVFALVMEHRAGR